MNLLKFHGLVLENIHENVMIFDANFMNLLSSIYSDSVGKYLAVFVYCNVFLLFRASLRSSIVNKHN